MRRLLAVLAFLFAGQALAETYYWVGQLGGPYPSAVAACTAWTNYIGRIHDKVTFENGPANGSCWGKDAAGNSWGINGTASRRGDSCPEGATYNAATGACDAPPPNVGEECEDQTGAGTLANGSPDPMIVGLSGSCTRFTESEPTAACTYLKNTKDPVKLTRIKGTVNYDTGAAVPPARTSVGPCEMSVVSSSCVVPAAKQKDGVSLAPTFSVCDVTVEYSGRPAAVIPPDGGLAHKNDICIDPTKCNLPEPTVEKESKPCIYVTDAEGRQVCTSFQWEGKQGEIKCGTVNGTFTCSDELKKPVSGGIEIATNVKTEATADGKTKITKTDKLTETNCKGATGQGCTAKSTTSVSIIIKDGSGQTESTTGTCTGPHCPDKNTNPDGDGDGFGDCTGDDCGSGEGSDGGGSVGELAPPELGEVADYQQTTQQFYSRVKGSPLMTAVGGIHAPATGTAPNMVSAPIAALGGASLDLSVIDQLMPIIRDILSLVMKAVWCFVALCIFLMA